MDNSDTARTLHVDNIIQARKVQVIRFKWFCPEFIQPIKPMDSPTPQQASNHMEPLLKSVNMFLIVKPHINMYFCLENVKNQYKSGKSFMSVFTVDQIYN